jgi:hypothetical protein
MTSRITQFVLRYLRFVAIGTGVVFLVGFVLRVAMVAIYGPELKGGWSLDLTHFAASAFVAAVLGLNRHVTPYLWDPGRDRRHAEGVEDEARRIRFARSVPDDWSNVR